MVPSNTGQRSAGATPWPSPFLSRPNASAKLRPSVDGILDHDSLRHDLRGKLSFADERFGSNGREDFYG